MRKTIFKNMNQFDFLDGVKIEVLTEKYLKVHFQNEDFYFSDDNKKPIGSETGEVVLEYSGLNTDGESTRSFAKASFAPKGSSVKHFHNILTENYYIFSGEGLVIIDDKIHKISAGCHIHIAPGQIHQVINLSENQHLNLLVLCQPAWRIEDFHPVTDTILTTSFEMK
jgi:mannose-6-phosphate isomerase-like protein (cupin superfamily)